MRQVFFWLDQQQIQLPVSRGPEAVHEIIWRPARYHAVLSVLQNPIYAGAYAYGRSKTMVRLEDGQKRVRRQRQRCRGDWAVSIFSSKDEPETEARVEQELNLLFEGFQGPAGRPTGGTTRLQAGFAFARFPLSQ